MDNANNLLTQDLLSLANDLLHVKHIDPNIIDFKTNSESKAWFNNIKISFSGRVF